MAQNTIQNIPLTVRALTSLYIALFHTISSKSFYFTNVIRSPPFKSHIIGDLDRNFSFQVLLQDVCTVFQLCKHLRRDFVYIQSMRHSANSRLVTEDAEFPVVVNYCMKSANLHASGLILDLLPPSVQILFPCSSCLCCCVWMCVRSRLSSNPCTAWGDWALHPEDLSQTTVHPTE